MEPYTVQAEFSFKGENNDELCFKKGDIITVTQREDGGWWEGTLDDMTGWFPSNYVKEIKAILPLTETIRPPEEIQAYRSVVLTDLLESEKAHVAEVRGLLENFLEPLSLSQILTSDEYAQLMCNFIEVVQTHEELLQSLEECNDRVGKLFLNKASLMKSVHQAYCAAHPRAIVILDKYKDELEKFMERQGAATPGLLVLTTGLSKPFRRLDKYSAMLQELERHMESGHPDRGDTQRSIAVYKEMASICSATRRQKELELQVLTGPVRGWQGQELSTLGDIIHMGSVAVGADHRDRYFVLFPQTLLILSVSQRMSAFIYEGKLPLTCIKVNRLDDNDSIKNAFEVSGPLIEKITAVCQGPNEANKWVDLLSSNSIGRQQQRVDLKRNVSTSAVNVPQPPPHSITPLDSRGYCTRSSIYAYSLGTPSYRLVYPPQSYPPTAPYTNLTMHFKCLVKDGILKRSLVKALLYPQFISNNIYYNKLIENVKLRRQKRGCGRRTTRTTKKHSKLTTTNSSSIMDKNLSRQNAFDSKSNISSTDEDDDNNTDCLLEDDDDENGSVSCSSSPFGFVRYNTGKKTSDLSNQTDYETFIDHVEEEQQQAIIVADCTKKIFDSFENRQLHKSGIDINRDSDGSFIFSKNKFIIDHTVPPRDSLPIHSNPVKIVLPKKTPSKEIILHTSTAQLNIGKLKHHLPHHQQQQQLQLTPPDDRHDHTSYDVSICSDEYGQRVPNKNMACEDLRNIDDSIILKNKLIKPPVIDERHSMPTLFVGNRFNSSPMTEVFIPTYKDKTDIKLTIKNDSSSMKTKYNELSLTDSNSTSASTTTHSSSVDLPAIMPVSDKLTAELLYNFHNQYSNINNNNNNNNNNNKINKNNNRMNNKRQPPPNEFDNSHRISLSREASPFNKHSLNSDKKILTKENSNKFNNNINNLETNNTQQQSDIQKKSSNGKRSGSLKRCVSYQYVQLKMNQTQSTPPSKTDSKDGKSKKCTCCASSRCPSPRSSDSGMAGSCTITSPDPPKINDDYFTQYDIIDGVYRDANNNILLRHSRSSHNFGRYNGSELNSFHHPDESDNDRIDSGQYGESNSVIRDDHQQNYLQQARNIFELSTSRGDTVKQHTRCKSIERSIDLHSLATSSSSSTSVARTKPIDRTGVIVDMQGNMNGAIFKTGLYAHWWKKEYLPSAMLRELIVLKYNRDKAAANQRHDSNKNNNNNNNHIINNNNCNNNKNNDKNIDEAVRGSEHTSNIGNQSTNTRHNTNVTNVSTQTQSFIQSSSQLQPTSTKFTQQQQNQSSDSAIDQRENKPFGGVRRKERREPKS